MVTDAPRITYLIRVRRIRRPAREGLTSGDVLRQKVELKDRELTQNEVVRDIREYAALEAARDTLIAAARDARDTVPDMPPGMTLDQAMADIAARIAEHDRYVIELKEGYLISRLATADDAASEGAAMPGTSAEIGS
jgi:hypothetical protein